MTVKALIKRRMIGWQRSYIGDDMTFYAFADICNSDVGLISRDIRYLSLNPGD